MYKTAKLASFDQKVNYIKNFNATFFSRLSFNWTFLYLFQNVLV